MSIVSAAGNLVQAAASALNERRARAGEKKALVPAASIAGRALVTVVAIMTFLAALTAGAAILIADASTGWQSEVAREMTVQILPAKGRDVDADAEKAATIARNTPGVALARPYTKAESERCCSPGLAATRSFRTAGAAAIVIRLEPGASLDTAALGRALAEAVPGATLDDHQRWLERLAVMAKTVVAVAGVIFALVLVAMILAVAFATRGAMAGNREIIEVLHFVGAADDYISRQFQRHFFQLGLRGGAIGGGAAILAFFAASTLPPGRARRRAAIRSRRCSAAFRSGATSMSRSC